MTVHASVSSLIAEIYEAALDASRWVTILGCAAQHVGGSAAALWLNKVPLAPNDQFHFGGDAEFKAPILARFQEKPQRSPHRNDGRTDDAETSVPALRHIEIFETELRAQLPSTTFSRKLDEGVSRFAVCRHRRSEPWDEAALQCILPHIRCAAMISRLIGIDRAAADVMESTLNVMDTGVFFLDAEGRTLHANAKGNAILAEGRLLRSVKGRLVTNGSEIAPALGESHAPEFSRASRVHVLESRASAEAGGAPHIAHMFPVSTGKKRRAGCNRAVATIVLHETAWHAEGPAARIARHYKLAAREHQVLEAILQGRGLKEIAEKLEITPSAVKTHLRRLFEKTGTRRQIDLIKLCAAFRSPFLTIAPDA